VISAAVLLPHPPLLLRELGGAQDPVAALREAAVAAVKAAVAGASSVVVVGGHDEDGDWSADAGVDVRRFGTTGDHPTRPGLPTSLGVGRRLLEEAGWDGPVELVAARWHAGPGPVAALAERLGARPDGTVLLVLGDGSARRGEKAPGYLDARAFGFDDAVASALAGGDVAALRDLDAVLAEELMVAGSTALRLLGAVAAVGGSTPVAAMTYRDDPFGVSYFVATWTF
jgi:hypothetical protein